MPVAPAAPPTAGGRARPNKTLQPGETVVLADLEGPGVIRHIWVTIPVMRPERMRSQIIEVRYDGRDEPSIAAPLLDFFGLPHGRPAAYTSAVLTAQEGRGFNCYLPIPFRERVHITYTNHADREVTLYYQVDYTLQPELPAELGYLHVAFRRENPTVQKRDFVITEGLRGPGRFLGCAIGVRVIDHANWYGEGEVKVFRDGDHDLPTICGTGLEDYVGTAWGMGQHHAPYGGVPLCLSEHGDAAEGMGVQPDFVSFYRWHLPDPIMFERDLTVTIQQIGAMFFPAGPGGGAGRLPGDQPGGRRGLDHRHPPGDARLGHLRAGRRLLVHVVRVLHGAPVGARRRRGRRHRRHRPPPLREDVHPGDRGRHPRRQPEEPELPMHHLTEAEQAQYERDGYLVRESRVLAPTRSPP